MKKYFLYFTVCLLFTNCSYKITRIGYEYQNNNNKNVDIEFVKNYSFPDSTVIKIGEIKLNDSGFTVGCKADFYKIEDQRFEVESDSTFLPQKISDRVAKDRKRNTVMIAAYTIAGIAVGLLL